MDPFPLINSIELMMFAAWPGDFVTYQRKENFSIEKIFNVARRIEAKNPENITNTIVKNVQIMKRYNHNKLHNFRELKILNNILINHCLQMS